MPRTYRKVNDEMRFELIRQVHEDHFSIKEAAKNLEIQYENAKAIFRVHRTKNRIAKLKTRKRCTSTRVMTSSKDDNELLDIEEIKHLRSEINQEPLESVSVRLGDENTDEAAELKNKIEEHISEVERDTPEFSPSNTELSLTDRQDEQLYLST